MAVLQAQHSTLSTLMKLKWLPCNKPKEYLDTFIYDFS